VARGAEEEQEGDEGEVAAGSTRPIEARGGSRTHQRPLPSTDERSNLENSGGVHDTTVVSFSGEIW
jgi:hypothetical protein